MTKYARARFAVHLALPFALAPSACGPGAGESRRAPTESPSATAPPAPGGPSAPAGTGAVAPPAPSGAAPPPPSGLAAASPAGPAAPSAPAPGGPSIACGRSACRAPGEICCARQDDRGRTSYACKPAPAVTDESGLLRACGGRREGLTAMACDDSGDCASGRLCCSPIRHGSGANFSTHECLSPNDCFYDSAGIEMCVPGPPDSCQKKGTVCHKNGVCAPPLK